MDFSFPIVVAYWPNPGRVAIYSFFRLLQDEEGDQTDTEPDGKVQYTYDPKQSGVGGSIPE